LKFAWVQDETLFLLTDPVDEVDVVDTLYTCSSTDMIKFYAANLINLLADL
jgi:hypothetical protein